MSNATLILGEALMELRKLASCSVDSVVTDPPAGIGLMGKEWDDFRRARNAADVDRPNVFGRTSAKGPEYGRRGRDNFTAWLAEIMAEALRVAKPGAYALVWAIPRTSHWTGIAIEDAGWVIQDRISHLFGQGFPKHRSKLKPACEDWWLAWKPDRKATPLPGLDGCRLSGDGLHEVTQGLSTKIYGNGEGLRKERGRYVPPVGRWPANVTLDEEAAAMLDEQSGELTSGNNPAVRHSPKTGDVFGLGFGDQCLVHRGTDSGGASRFFYVAKASKANREAGNAHPTVKPLAVMRWLCRLITPKGGIVLDQFMGSGTTGLAALEEGFGFIGIEREAEYFAVAKRRIEAPAGPLFA